MYNNIICWPFSFYSYSAQMVTALNMVWPSTLLSLTSLTFLLAVREKPWVWAAQSLSTPLWSATNQR